ncbi:pilus assembly protein PilP [Vibrio maerlii]|uniref:pilus assembly protein PilP n=1 Tax=Vibrio maerlii TaxID=2231648 RepID=UPI001F145BB1|nr:pilus assembly protein PilP [Vibrio maerlii]
MPLSLLLIGCQANQESLETFVQQTEHQARSKAEPLPNQREFLPQEYIQYSSRNPFQLPVEALVQNQPEAKNDCWQPSQRGQANELEKYSLKTLKLKGSIASGGVMSGLVETPSGTVIQVEVGQYIGLNHGRIIKVDKDYLTLKETIPDGLGCWQQRDVRLALR